MEPGDADDRKSRAALVEAWRRRVGWILFLRRATELSILGLFGAGVGVLVARAGLRWAGPELLAVLLALPPLWAWAARDALRARPSARAARAALERHNGAGGLLAAEAERSLGAWGRTLGRIALPPVRWRAGPRLALLGIGALFLVASLLTPVSVAGPAVAETPLRIAAEAERIEKQVETLAGERVLREREARELAKRVREIEKHADGRDPARTWEALDRTRRKLRERGEAEAERIERQRERLAQSASAARAARKRAAEGDAKLGKRMERLEKRLEKAAAAQRRLGDAESAKRLRKQAEALEAAKGKRGGEKLAKRLAQLERTAERSRHALGQRAKRMHEARLIDGETLARAKAGGCAICRAGKGGKGGTGRKAGKTGPAKRAGSLASSQKDGARSGSRAAKRGGKPGAGGLDRGPGEAPMWRREKPSPESGARFEAKKLPADALPALEHSRRVGARAARPETNGSAAGSKGGGLSERAAGEAGAAGARVLPKHRDAVRGYFDRDDKELAPG